MTENEIKNTKEWFEDFIETYALSNQETIEFKKAVACLDELQQYRAIGTVEELQVLNRIAEETAEYVKEDKKILEAYKRIGTIEEFKALKDKKPKKKKSNKVIFSHDSYPHCPHCGRSITGAFMNPRLCPKCHGELDWH